MHFNWLAILVAAFVPLIMGMIWYHPKFMGKRWMISSNLNEAQIKNVNVGLVLTLSFFFAMLLSFVMQMLVIHQMHVASLFAHYGKDMQNPNTQVGSLFKTIMDNYGSEFRTFKHGMLHGLLSAIFIVLPVLATNAMFEKKSWTYIWINWGYWAVNFMIMGGIISAWQ